MLPGEDAGGTRQSLNGYDSQEPTSACAVAGPMALVVPADLPETSGVKIAVAWYCILVGLLMVAWWANDLRLGAWNRGDRTRGEMGLHLMAEFVTAGLLIASGSAWLAGGSAGDTLVAASLGMLLYTAIVSPGYFLARRDLPGVGMFAVLAALTIAALAATLTS